MAKFLQKAKELTPYLLVVGAITLPWFFVRGYLFFTDFAMGPVIPVNWNNGWFFIDGSFKLLSYLLPVAFIEKIFISAVFLLLILAGKKILEQILDSYWQVFVGSLFFVFNPFIYERALFGQFGVVLSTAFLGLCFGYLLSFREKSKRVDFLLSAFFAGLSILFTQGFLFLLLLLYAGMIGLCLFEKRLSFGQLFKWSPLAAILVLAVNANWLLAALTVGSPIEQIAAVGISKIDYMIFKPVGKTVWDVLSNLFMLSGFWGRESYRFIDLSDQSDFWGRSFFLILPVLLIGVAAGLKSAKNRALSVMVLVLFALSIVFAAGMAIVGIRPFTLWLFEHVPYYSGLRDTQKWTALSLLLYTPIIGMGIKAIFAQKFAGRYQTILLVSMGAVFLLHAPLLLFGFGWQVKPASYPQEWEEVDAYILEQDGCQSSILFLPYHLYMGMKWVGNVTVNPAGRFFSCRVYSGKSPGIPGLPDVSSAQSNEAIKSWIEQKGAGWSLQSHDLDIRYVILVKEVDWLAYEWLNEVRDLQLVKEMDGMILYEFQYETN